MSLESVFKLSLIMNMIDNLSGPMAGVASKVGANVSKLDAASQTFGNMAKAGALKGGLHQRGLRHQERHRLPL